jgi:hypothetical protein
MNIEELKELISLLPDREQEDLCVSIMAKKTRGRTQTRKKAMDLYMASVREDREHQRQTERRAARAAPARARASAARAAEQQRRNQIFREEKAQQEEDRDYAEFVQHYHNPDGAPEVIQSDDDNDYEEITVDGVEYQRSKEDNTVIRIADFSPVGIWNTGTGKIDFDDEEEGGGGIKKKKTKKKKNKKKKKKKLSKKKKK